MSAMLRERQNGIRPMLGKDIDAVISVENRACEFPWSRMNFHDCLYAGYCCQVLEQDGALAGYAIMSIIADESHMLNLCIDPDYQSAGLGRNLLNHLLATAWQQAAKTILLEVRSSNLVAIKLYFSSGFEKIGNRKNYYPAKTGHEDALILARTILEG